MFDIPGYKFIRNDRGLKSSTGKREYMQGGGVSCYLRNDFVHRVLEYSQIENINETEYLIIDLMLPNNQRVLLCSVYRRPKGQSLTTFFITLSKYIHLYSNIIIAGDFNADLLTDNYYNLQLRTLIEEYSFYIVPSGASHHRASSDTWLDVVIVDSGSKVTHFTRSLSPFINCHDYIIIDYSVPVPAKKNVSLMSRDFRNFNHSIFSNELTKIINDNLLELDTESCNVNLVLNEFRGNVVDLLDNLAPFTPRNIRKNPAPWLTPELKAKCKMRDQLYKRAKRLNSRSLFAEYRTLRTWLKHEIRRVRDVFLLNCLSSAPDQSKRWNILNKFGLVKDKVKSPLHFFQPEELISFYAEASCVHPSCSVSDLNQVLAIQSLMSTSKFSFSPLTLDEVHQAMLDCLSKAKGRSYDGLSLAYFKEAIPVIVPFFMKLFNCSIKTCCYPDLWKKSLIIPISKVPLPSEPAKTRPVANLSHFAKVFDSLLTKQLTEFLETNKFLSDYQSGFRSHFSTQTALIKLTEDIRRGMERGLLTILILFDFKRAFDSINHKLLLLEMKKLNFSNEAISLMHSYLSDRSQAVVDSDGKTTRFLPITSGVPQGSTPGPIIFLIFINSIVSTLTHCRDKCLLFADDLQIYIQCKPSDLASTINNLNADAEAVVQWAKTSGLPLNVAKTKTIMFASVQHHMRLVKSNLPPVIVDGVIIPYERTVKNLGVIFSEDLSWNAQVSQICSRVHGMLYRLRYRGHCLSSQVKAMLVNALIIPHFDYACLVYLDLTQYLAIKIQRLANVLIRFIFRLKRDTALKPFVERLGWLSLENRRKYFLGLLTYKTLVSGKPTYLYNLFPPISSTIRRSERIQSSIFDIPLARTAAYRNSFSIEAMLFWESIPTSIRLKQSTNVFKTSLYNYLLESESNVRTVHSLAR